MARQRAKARAVGLCITCFKRQPEEGRRVCRPCRESARDRVLRRRITLRERAKLQHVIQAHEEAGDVAREHHLYEAAAQRYQLALNVAAMTSEDRLRISEKLFAVAFLGANPSITNPWLEHIVPQHFQNITEKASTVELLLQRSRQLWVDSKTEEALPLIAKAIQVSKEIANPYFFKMANLKMTSFLRSLSRYEDAKRFLYAIGDIDVNDDATLRTTYYIESAIIASAFGEAAKAYEDFERAVNSAEDDPDLYRVTVLWESYGLCAMSLGNTDLAKTCMERALLIARQNQIVWRIPHLCLYYADLLACMGQYEIANHYLLDALSYDAHAPILDIILAAVGIPLALRMDDEATLEKCIRPSTIRIAFESHLPDIGPLAAAFAQLYAIQGRMPKARKLLHKALESVPHVHFNWDLFSCDLLLEIARMGAMADIPHARRLLEVRAALPYAEVAKTCLNLFDALVAQRRKRFELAQLHASAAAVGFDALHWYGHAALARSLLPDASQAQPVIRPSGAFSGIPTKLTLREQQVAELMLKGMTNREIAIHLSITKHTVDSHVASIINRLGIRSRYQLADALPPTDSNHWVQASGITN